MSVSTKCMIQLFCGLIVLGILALLIWMVTFGKLNEYTTILQPPQMINISVTSYNKTFSYSDEIYPESLYLDNMIKWSISPNSFCFENYMNFVNYTDSSIIILSISNLNELNRNLIISHKFIFYLRISRILYANKYGYKYCEFQETFDISKPPHWSKWNAIRMISTLINTKHILWIDIDAIFHSKTSSIENSGFYKNDYNKNKLFIFTQSGMNKGINAGVFMINTDININFTDSQYGHELNLNFLDILDLFSYIEISKNIKQWTPPYEQHILRVFRKEYKTQFNTLCVMLGVKQMMQQFGIKRPNYKYFIWHWTGIDQRYKKMIPVIKKEIELFLNTNQSLFDKKYILNLIDSAIRQYNLENIIQSAKKHIFEPEWIKNSLICESTWWKKEKTINILGRVYEKEERKPICEQNW